MGGWVGEWVGGWVGEWVRRGGVSVLGSRFVDLFFSHSFFFGSLGLMARKRLFCSLERLGVWVLVRCLLLFITSLGISSLLSMTLFSMFSLFQIFLIFFFSSSSSLFLTSSLLKTFRCT